MAVADVTGDGKLDIVVANYQSNTVSVLLGNGDGTFQPQQTFATGLEPRAVAIGDVNGDGKADVVVANFGSNTVSVLLGNGNGTFAAQQTFACGFGPVSVVLGDLTGDGKADIAVANFASNTVSVLLGNGDGTFEVPQSVATSIEPLALAVGDVNGDGIPDLAVANVGDGTVSVLLGNGNGSFAVQQTFATGLGPASVAFVHPLSVVMGDVNGDGIADIAVANYSSNSVSVLLGNGDGTFQTAQTFATESSPGALALADTNGDGKSDLVVANFKDNTASVLQNTADGSFTGQVYTIFAPNTHFIVTAPNATTTGNGFVFTVTALTTTGNPNPAYTGTVHFSSTDPLAGLPANAALFNGTGVFAAVLNTIGTQTITVNDTTSTASTGTSAPITVVPPATASFSIAANPLVTPAGSPVIFEVTALDSKGNIIPAFSGTVHFSSSDAQASLPADATLTNGIGFFSAILKTAGRQTLYVSDAANGGATGTSAPITVTPGAATHFGVSAPAAAVTGNAFTFTVTALDPYGNIAPSYAGTVHISSTDSAAALPPDATLSAGVGIFTATLNTAGNNTLSVLSTATSSIAGTSGIIATRGLAVSSFTPTPTGFAVTFDKAFNPSTLSLYVGTPDVKLVTSSGQTVRGSLVLNTAAGAPPDTSFTFIATAGLLAAGTDTVTIAGGPTGLHDTSGYACTTFVTAFTAVAPAGAVLSIPDFARGPNSAANIVLPNSTGNGIPITLSNAVSVTDVTFNLAFNPALLNINGALSSPAGVFALVSNTAGVASFSFQSPTPLSGTLTLGNIIAQVPNSAAASYKSKALLHLSDIVINGSITTPTNKDGIEAVAYLGDVAGTGSFNPLDAALIGEVAVNAAPGFAAYPLLDPAIIGDVSGNGIVNSADVTLMNRLLAGIATPQIPQPPSGLTIPAERPRPYVDCAGKRDSNSRQHCDRARQHRHGPTRRQQRPVGSDLGAALRSASFQRNGRGHQVRHGPQCRHRLAARCGDQSGNGRDRHHAFQHHADSEHGRRQFGDNYSANNWQYFWGSDFYDPSIAGGSGRSDRPARLPNGAGR